VTPAYSSLWCRLTVASVGHRTTIPIPCRGFYFSGPNIAVLVVCHVSVGLLCPSAFCVGVNRGCDENSRGGNTFPREASYLLEPSSARKLLANPIQSWTADATVARDFANQTWNSEGDGYVVSATIPTDRILSLPEAMGTQGESEFTVLNGESGFNVRVTKVVEGY
jgi:hypothetical protein